MKTFCRVFICFLLIGSCSAQDWGEISEEELTMTGVPEDPEADAIILFDRGEMIINAQFDLIFRHHQRIKILTEKGKEYADIRINYDEEDKVQEIQAQSFSPGGKKTKLAGNMIYDKEAGSWKQKTFAIPGVELGSVIEYRYEIISAYIHYLDPWYFQHNAFTKESEIRLSLQPGLTFNSFQENLIYFNPVSTKEREWDIDKRGRMVDVYAWKLENIPALKLEPFIYNREDYLARITFQLLSYKNTYTDYTYIQTWDDIAKIAHNRFKSYLTPDSDLEDLIAELTSADSTERSRIKSIYDFVRNRVLTEDESGFYQRDIKKAGQVIEQKKGNSLEKNLLLINLLRSAGFQVHPVLISTRSHGRLKPEFATFRQFNHLIVAVNVGEGKIFLDTSDPFCTFGLLPENCMVQYGILIEEEKGKLTAIPNFKGQNRLDILTEAYLSQDGAMLVQSTLTYEGYEAIDERHNLSGTNSREYWQNKLNDLFIGAKIDSIHIPDLNEDYKPLVVWIKFEIPNYGQVNNDLIYFPPPFLSKISTNPFKNPKRFFPVDYDYPTSYLEKVKVLFPPGFKLAEEPLKSRQVFQNFSFTLFPFAGDKEIEIQRSFKIIKESILPNEYKNIRLLYDEMVSSDQRQIVLSRK